MIRGVRLLGAVIMVATTATACGANDGETIAFVPSSFTDVVAAVDAFDNPDADEPEWVIAGSSQLLRQLLAGADADLLITADQASMDTAVAAGIVTEELGVVARNRLVLAVAPGNPGGVDDIEDLTADELLLGVCASAVPCGRLAAAALSDLGVTVAADTEESSVRALAIKISRGELDAGLVYATDALSLDLATVDDDRLGRFVTDYPAAAIGGNQSEIVDFLRSPTGRTVLVGLGFEVP